MSGAHGSQTEGTTHDQLEGLMEGCLACDLMDGRRELPGRRIHESDHWIVEHCVGPMPIGTLVLKPRRHCLHIWGLELKPESSKGTRRP